MQTSIIFNCLTNKKNSLFLLRRRLRYEAVINAMTLDDPTSVKADEEIFVRTRLSWLKPIEGVAQFEAGRNL